MLARLPFIALYFLVCFYGYGQSTIIWNGSGDGTTWQLGSNWVGGVEPNTGDIAHFSTGGSVIVTGTPSNNPGKIDVSGATILTLDLDVTISNSTANIGIEIGTNSTINLGVIGNNRTINISPDATAVAIKCTSNVSSVTIANSTSVLITQGIIGIEIANSTVSFINNGNLTISGVTDGIIYTSGSFNNSSTGSITINNTIDDCIELSDLIFTNTGIINATCPFNGNSNNNGLSILSGGVFSNSGIFNGDGNGGTSTSRSIQIESGGQVYNSGTINITGGNIGAGIRLNGGSFTNEVGGILDITRLSLAGGVFTNNGLIKSNHPSQGILRTGTGGDAINNAFYSYDNSSVFSTGSVGTTTDNGIDANDGARTSFDAGSTNEVADIGINVAYTWYDDASKTNQVAANDMTGKLIFEEEDISTPMPETIYTEFGSDVVLTFSNVLPIELISFEVSMVYGQAYLEWITGSELGNFGFEILRSSDGLDWTSLAFVDGNGTSSNLNYYEFKDRYPNKGINYYQLKQIDYDGNTEFFPIRFLVNNDSLEPITTYPNPALNELRLNFAGRITNDVLEIIDNAGQIMPFQIDNDNKIDISHFPSGIYFIIIQLGKDVKSIKFVKN